MILMIVTLFLLILMYLHHPLLLSHLHLLILSLLLNLILSLLHLLCLPLIPETLGLLLRMVHHIQCVLGTLFTLLVNGGKLTIHTSMLENCDMPSAVGGRLSPLLKLPSL
jgi:hypothetical protein